MKKAHIENTVGPWAENKLRCLEDYLKFYSIALSKQFFTRVYIDAFAGSCVSRVRASSGEAEADILGGVEDAKAQDQFLLGSPLRALQIENGFHKHYFFDLDESRAAVLEQLKTFFPKKIIEVQVGDSNPLIQGLASELTSPKIRGVAFLDPYGPHLHWKSVEALANAKNFEVIINFPAAMAINRLITRSGAVPDKWDNLLNNCFGTSEWRTIAYQQTVDLFGDSRTTKNENVAEKLLDLYRERLRKIFAHVATPRLVRNSRGAPLYYLIWAGQHSLGLKGADYILAQGEKVSLAKRRQK